jgi:hypothetical protein
LVINLQGLENSIFLNFDFPGFWGLDFELFLLFRGLAIEGAESRLGRGWGGRCVASIIVCLLEGNFGADASIVRRGIVILRKKQLSVVSDQGIEVPSD